MSLFNRRTKLVDTDFFSGFNDCHSHILPGVDDGANSDAKALRILAEFESMGIERVILTPHVMSTIEQNTAESLRASFDIFSQKYEGSIELSLGAEYMLDYRFERHLASEDLLAIAEDHLLVETSYAAEIITLRHSIEQVMRSGYFAVLAHPERYLYMRREEYSELFDRGVKLQLNLLSLSGYYGKEAKGRAEYLLERGMYSIAGSDIHSLRHFQHWVKLIDLTKRQLNALNELKCTEL